MAINSLSSTRITGLASGLDTESIVESLMQIEQLKVNRELRSQTLLKWKEEALESVASELTTFKQTYMSVLSPSNMMSSGVYNVFDVTLSGTNTSAVTISANATAVSGSHVIDQVVNLAEASRAESSAGVSGAGQLSESNSALLKDLDFSTPLTFESGKISFSINGEAFEFSETDSLQKMLNTINSSSAGVTMNYSRLTDKFTLSTKETGAATELIIENTTGNAFGDTGAFKIGTGTIQNGEDASVVIDGVSVTRSSNQFSIDGISYTLNEETAVGETISFRLTQNVDTAVDKIKSFVDAYNKLIMKLDGLLTERKSIDEQNYTPLTEDEKLGMSEEQIEKWETIAKKGMLYNDSSIRGMLDSLRKTLYTAVEEAGLSPAQIGIKTGDWRNKGQLVVDETALRSALQKDPQQVMSIFTNISESEDPATAYAENGLLRRISNIMTQYDDRSDTTLDTISDNLKTLTEKIDTMEEKMAEIEEKYFKKFTAMETAMSKLQSQSSWISSLMGTVSN
jgi:flagellar hook-associated protein 2